MRDLEQMRKNAEKQIALAERENKINEGLEYISLALLGDSFGHKGFIQASCKDLDGWSKNITLKGVGEALAKFPPTCMSKVYAGSGTYKEMQYDMQVHRSVRDSYTMLRIKWTHEDLDISVELPIVEELQDFFVATSRELTESEMNLSGIKKTRWNYDYRHNFPFLMFGSGKMVHFQGGYITSNCDSLVSSIVEHIKYIYEFGE